MRIELRKSGYRRYERTFVPRPNDKVHATLSKKRRRKPSRATTAKPTGPATPGDKPAVTTPAKPVDFIDP
jgi:hypothetical protein